MSKELIAALNALEKENGISKEVMLDTIEKSLKDEFKNQFNTTENCEVELDRVTGEFHIYANRTVVEEITPAEQLEENKGKKEAEKFVYGKEIALADAKKIKPDCQIGDVLKIEIKSEEFSRRAAKSAKGTIVQKIREEEKAAIFNEYHSKEHEIITGIVQRIDDKGNILVDIGRTQTTLKKNECVKGENYQRGDRIKLYVLEVSNGNRNADSKGDKEKSGPLVIRVSRKTPLLVKRLFEEEVSEIKDGIVKIVSIAREEGSRTKIAVKTDVPNVDPVGACVGINGARVKAIVNELGNEQIDIIEWDENPAQYIVNALSPAKVVSISAYYDDENAKKATVVVSDQQFSLAIGKAGQNVRLAAKLTGYGIDIKSESQMEEAEEALGDDVEELDDTLTFTEDTDGEEFGTEELSEQAYDADTESEDDAEAGEMNEEQY